MSDRRRRTRVQSRFAGVVYCGGEDIPVATEDLSLKGALCESVDYAVDHVEGEACIMRVVLSDSAVIEVSGKIVRARGNDLAIDFENMDPDSYAHLRNVVRMLSEDADLIDEEQFQGGFGDEDADAFEH